MQTAAHASKLTVAGVEYRVRRDFGLILRLEETFGELGAFFLRADRERLKTADIAQLYRILLADQPQPASDDAIQAHIVQVGTVAALRQPVIICGMLFLGEDRFMAILPAAKPEDRLNPPPAPALTGAVSTAPLAGSDGPPINSGAPHSSS